MATVNFKLRGTKEVKTIYLTLYYGDSEYTFSTKQKVRPEDWNDQRNEVRKRANLNFDKINRHLQNIEARVLEIHDDLERDGRHINNTLLKSEMDKGKEKNLKLSSVVSEFIGQWLERADSRYIAKGNGKRETLKESTLKQYRNTKGKLEAYDNLKGSKTLFENLSLDFHMDFTEWLREELNLSDSTIATRIKDLKSISVHAKEAGIKMNEAVFSRKFSKPSYESKSTYLNEEEITRIFNFEFSDNPRLDNVRDAFILSLWTGLRVSDLTSLTDKNINLEKGYIETVQEKTGDPVVIPLHPQAEAIIVKNGGKLPRFISRQRFNDYTKEVCQIVGINESTEGTKRETEKGRTRAVRGSFPKYELITSHTGRRSFATNAFLQGIPTLTIMKCTGHKSEAAFMKYIKVTPSEHAEILREQWKKAAKDEVKNPYLKAVSS